MELTCVVVLVLFLINQSVGSPGDPVMYLPPFEVRTLDINNRLIPFGNTQFISTNQRLIPQQQQPQQQPSQPQQPQQSILHTTQVPTPPPPIDPVPERPRDHHNLTLNDFVEVLNEMTEHNEENQGSDSRAAEKDYESAPPPYPPYPSYPPYGGYSRPYGPPRQPSYGGYGPPAYHASQPGGYGPSAYHAPQPTYTPHAPVHASKTVNPILTGLLKPVTTKVASKVSGLIGLVLTLLTGSAPDGLELTGFKDIVINGIVKPLLIAKGGIKSLISKLSIPVLSLLLINVEVLLTVWWLWEECPQHTPTYSYSKPTHNYNNY